VEHRLYGSNRGERFPKLIEQRSIQDTGPLGGLIGVVFENVPGREREVIQVRERNEIPDQRTAPFGPLTQPDGGELGDRSNGFRQTPANSLDAGDEGCRDSSHTRDQNPEFSSGGRYFGDLFHTAICLSSGIDATAGPVGEFAMIASLCRN